ncbi:hypothetical protein VB737_09815 [Synechococcus sp. BA-120 BA3]|nr:hypothetical protein [Synechococcus sp. BA-120 BA3]
MVRSTPPLRAEDPIPGFRLSSSAAVDALQRDLLAGACRIPLLPLGSDAVYIWVPGNGHLQLQWAWLLASGSWPDPQDSASATAAAEVQTLALAHTRWLHADQLEGLAGHRSLVAVWRDPIERFVAACRRRLHALPCGEGHATPVERMNQVALALEPSWPRDWDWCLRTLPQSRFLSGRADLYTTLLDPASIPDLVAHWSRVRGTPIPGAPAEEAQPTLHVEDLLPEAVQALERTYAEDRAFLALARARLGSASPFPGRS